MLRLVSCSLACSLLAVGCHGASTSSNAPPDAAVAPPCTFASTETAMDSFAASDVDLHVESNGDAGLEIVRKDLATYLGTLWGGTFTASTNAPDFSHRLTIWASTSTDAKTLAGFSGTTGYAITRVDAQAGTTIVVAANDDADLAFGTYALLEELGIRFFPPKAGAGTDLRRTARPNDTRHLPKPGSRHSGASTAHATPDRILQGAQRAR